MFFTVSFVSVVVDVVIIVDSKTFLIDLQGSEHDVQVDFSSISRPSIRRLQESAAQPRRPRHRLCSREIRIRKTMSFGRGER